MTGRVYECKATILDGRESDILTEVHGIHETGRGNINVQYLWLIHQEMEFFPRNIEAFFPRLEALTFAGNAITDITINHLRPLSNLLFLDLAMNRITSLDSNLLSVYSTRSMNFIRFSSNNLKCVGQDFFFPNTREADFRFNPCINLHAVTTSQVANLRSNLLANCLPENCPPEIKPPENSPPENCPPIDCQSLTKTALENSNLITNLNGQVQRLLELVESNGNLLINLIRQLKLENALVESTTGPRKSIIKEVFNESEN